MNIRKTIATGIAAAGILAFAAAPAEAAHVAILEQTIGLNAAQVPAGGVQGSSGKITLQVFEYPDGDLSLCSDITTRRTGDLVAAHIHEAERGADGPVVFAADYESDGESTCTDRFDVGSDGYETILEIVDAPSDYYVNVHDTPTTAAIRGQLHDFDEV